MSHHLAQKQAEALAEHAETIRAAGRRTIEDVVDIGGRLTQAHKLCGSYANWLAWLDTEFGWKETTARSFVQVFEMSLSANFAELNLPISSLYLLARPSTPEAVRQEVFDLAAGGETPTVAEVQNKITKAKKPHRPSIPDIERVRPKAELQPDPMQDEDLIDQIIHLFEQLSRNAQVRCGVKLNKILLRKA